MGGINDSAFLEGHSYVYEGSKPGKIVTSLRKMGCKNGMFLFDEIDKIESSNKGQSVSNQMMAITDFTQNTNFIDQYMPEIPIDLSQMWFTFSLNDKNAVHHVLKNRMHFIEVSGYSEKDKQMIIDKHLVPEMIKSLKMNENDIIITNEIKKYMIDKYSKEQGIRDLKRIIETLYRRLNFLCKSVFEDGTFGDLDIAFKIDNFKLPYTLKTLDISTLLKNFEPKVTSFETMFI